jgi:hypothetical protein
MPFLVWIAVDARVCPDGRPERKEMLQWSILGRGQLVAGANSAIP